MATDIKTLTAEQVDTIFATLAQGVVNITEGLGNIETGSRIHRAMAALCEMRALGLLTYAAKCERCGGDRVARSSVCGCQRSDVVVPGISSPAAFDAIAERAIADAKATGVLPDVGIGPAPWVGDRGVQRTAVADRCAVCHLPAHLTDVPNTNEQHPRLGLACFACRDTHDTANKILGILSAAPSCQMNQTSIARKLGRKASSINRALWQLSNGKLIERPYKNVHEKPSATTYRLTDAGSRAHFANLEHKEQHNVSA